MTSSLPNIPNLIVMIRPMSFAYNQQTSGSNFFQQDKMVPDAVTLARSEFDSMVLHLRRAGIAVKVFDDVVEGLPDSVFSNNWMAHFPGKMIAVFPMFTENRRAEVRMDVIDWIREETNARQVIDLRNEVQANRFLEGTGSVVFDYRNKIAYACVSPRTNIPLFESFCREAGYEPISFQALDLHGNEIYHTNVVMSVGDRYALVCFDAIEDPVERQMLKLKLESTGHDLIPLSFQQMNDFAGNCIEVLNQSGESWLLMSTTAENALNDLQKFTIAKYSRLLAIDIPVIEQIGGGSVRCMITGLFKP